MKGNPSIVCGQVFFIALISHIGNEFSIVLEAFSSLPLLLHRNGERLAACPPSSFTTGFVRSCILTSGAPYIFQPCCRAWETGKAVIQLTIRGSEYKRTNLLPYHESAIANWKLLCKDRLLPSVLFNRAATEQFKARQSICIHV